MASRILFISQDSLNISNKVEITANAVSHQTINIEHSELLLEVVPKWVLAPPKDGWKQFPPDINWKGAELDTAYMQKLNLRIP